MTVKYSVVARGNPRDPQAPKKYYAQAQSTGTVDLRDVAEQVGTISTLSSIDMLAAIEGALIIITRALADGKTVNLGDFGSFSLRIHSEGTDTAKAFSVRNIVRTLIRFRPGKRFRAVLDQIEYEKTAARTR